ncbi:MAG: FUSC family protein [Solirubrobacterales bacterium]|nr:FUSC family protein [Solirubrobacterales bacterium]
MDLRRFRRQPGRRRRQTGAPSPPEPGSLTVAVRDAAQFDRRAVSARGGLLAAVPVVSVLAVGTIAWSAVAGVTMGAGAMLVGIAWRIRAGRPPLAVLAVDAMVMALSTFVGAVTGSLPWLHFVLLCLWTLVGGLLVGLGNRGGVVGNQAIIAFIVFGRFSQPAAASAGLAGLVLAGGLSQVLFLGLARWPTPLRVQRSATAAAYRVLSRLAAASGETSTVPAGTALDDAQDSLSSPALFGDPALMTLRSLVNEGHRLRIELSAIHALMRRPPAAGDPPREVAERMLQTAGRALDGAARAIEGDRGGAPDLSGLVAELSHQADGLAGGREDAASPLTRRLTALAGQLRAVAGLAVSAGEGGGLRARRPRRHTHRPLERLSAEVAELRANASLESPAGRHALRLAVVVLAAELISRHLPLQRGYWMVVAAATTLRPEYGATFTRGTERAVGTCLGVGLAGAIAVALHPAGGVTIVLVGLLAFAAYAVFPASFAAGFAFITALVVFLLNAISPDTLATAWARLLDTLIGGGLGLLAYAVWPTWSKTQARQALGDLLAAQGAYLDAILSALITGRRVEESQMRPLSRQARLARTTADAAVARSLSEPATRRIDAEQSQGLLAAMRRLIQAGHVLRLEVQDDGPRQPLPGLEPLAGDLRDLLSRVEGALRTRDPERDPAPARALPDLRARYRAFARSAPEAAAQEGHLAELDEIVDVANSLASLAGLDGPEAADAGRSQAQDASVLHS